MAWRSGMFGSCQGAAEGAAPACDQNGRSAGGRATGKPPAGMGGGGGTASESGTAAGGGARVHGSGPASLRAARAASSAAVSKMWLG
eukprot:3604283-Alexandrium_andersonii.AAC.1